jgi:putative cell wall-binding protein
MLSGIYESPYSATLEATSATPVEWEITDGNLPAGLTLNEHTGVISGTPTAIGTSNFIVKATNDADEDIKPFSITITPATPDSPDSLSVTIGDANATLNWHAPTDTGGSNIIKYMVRCEPTQGGSPQIIDNITATSKEITGLNNGTSYSFRVWAFNGKRWSNASTPVIATPGTAPVITSPSTILSVEQGLESSLTITATGKPSPRFSATLANGNALPNWISLNSATGKLTVRPSFYEKTGDTIIRVTATNAVSFATIDFTIRVRTVPKYSLVVTNGTGSGQYEEGEYVTITANSPPADKVFDCWSSTIWPLENKPSITFRMPPKDTTITALYRDAPTFTLYIYYSDGSGTYKPHTKIPIRAYRRYSGPVVFDKWTVEPAEYTHIVSDIYCANATITLPDLDDSQYNEIIVVGATYKDTLPSLRVSGDDRFGTAAAISQVSFVSTETVILVNGLNFPDALAATPLAYELDAPVLMVSGNTIHPETQAELNRLEPKNIIILGGSSAVSQSIENSLKSKYNVTRLSGNNRYGTAEAIANELLRQTKRQQFDTVILAYGLNYPDALGVGPGAALEGCPIIFTDKNNIPAETQRILAKANKVIIVGGSSVVSNAVQKQLTTTHRVTRLSGNSRYDTCIEIQKHFFSDTYNDSIFIATGTNFADALTGGVAAARNQSPIILIDGKASSLPEKTANYIWESSTKKAIVLGGTNAVNRTLEKQIRDLLN